MSEGRARHNNVDWDDMPPTRKAFCSFVQRFLFALADCQVDKKRTCIWRFGILDSLILLLHPLFGKTNWIQKLEWHHKNLKANFFNTALEHFVDIMAAPEHWSKKHSLAAHFRMTLIVGLPPRIPLQHFLLSFQRRHLCSCTQIWGGFKEADQTLGHLLVNKRCKLVQPYKALCSCSRKSFQKRFSESSS